MLVKVVIRDTDTEQGLKDLVRLVKKYRPRSAQFFVRINHRQVMGLKSGYGDRVALVYGDLLKRDKYDEVPSELDV